MVCLFTDCRCGEVLGLKWCDINLDKKQISINKQAKYLLKNNFTGYMQVEKIGKLNIE